jgi:hypothetical protein
VQQGNSAEGVAQVAFWYNGKNTTFGSYPTETAVLYTNMWVQGLGLG